MEADYSTTYRDGIIRENNLRWHDGEQRELITTPVPTFWTNPACSRPSRT